MVKKYKTQSKGADQTEKIAEIIAGSLKGGEIIELVSDLGGGKTTFTRGLARGLGVKGNVTSPTFVVSKVYAGKSVELHHYDFYRLGELGIMSEEIQEVLDNLRNVTVIEWAGDAHDLLPGERLISIEIKPTKEENCREIICSVPESIEFPELEVK